MDTLREALGLGLQAKVAHLNKLDKIQTATLERNGEISVIPAKEP